MIVHDLKVLLQDNMVKPSPGAIWIDVNFWDLFKYTINQVKVILFWCLFVIKEPVTIIWCKSLLPNLTTSFQFLFHICCVYFTLYSKERGRGHNHFHKVTFHFILVFFEVLVPFLKYLGYQHPDMGVFSFTSYHIVFLCPLSEDGYISAYSPQRFSKRKITAQLSTFSTNLPILIPSCSDEEI